MGRGEGVGDGMICPKCGHGNWGGDPYDTGCRKCGYDPADEEQQAAEDAAADNQRRDLANRSEETAK